MSQNINVFLEESMLNAVNNGFPRASFIYDNFDINIIKFNNVNINADNLINTVPALSQNILLTLNISCNREEQSISCLYILQTLRNDNAEFLSLSTDGISQYLDNTDAYVSVVEDELSALTIDEYTPNTQVPFFEICVGIFASVILVITLIAVLYDRNVCKRCSSRCYETDNAKVTAILKWAFQFYDFASDINFTIEIFFLMQLKREAYQDFNDGSLSDPNVDGAMLRTEALVSLVLGVGSFLFTIFPYGLNLYFNATIKNNGIIKNNSAAIQYFNSCPTLFVVLTVISGGIYPSLTVVSSKIFGLSMFNSGLTKYELNKLTKVKVISTVVCENLPQIVIQLVYMVVFGFAETNVRNAVILAFIGSILSVIISMLIWYINRTEFGTSAVIYYIELSKKHGMKLNMHERNRLDKRKLIHHQIIFNLTRDILNIPYTTLQLSYINVTDSGIIIRFIQFVNNQDLSAMQKSLRNNEDNYSTNKANFDDMFNGLSPKYYTKQLFKTNKKEILKMYYNHYNLSDFNNIDVWCVKYHNEMPLFTTITGNKTITNFDGHSGIEMVNYDNELQIENERLKEKLAKQDKLIKKAKKMNKYMLTMFTGNDGNISSDDNIDIIGENMTNINDDVKVNSVKISNGPNMKGGITETYEALTDNGDNIYFIDDETIDVDTDGEYMNKTDVIPTRTPKGKSMKSLPL